MSSPELKLTDEQQAIIAAIGQGSLMVEAGAGCAKSTTLEHAAKRVRTAALAVAFNKKIADGLKGRLPAQFKVSTMNGLGYGALLRGPLAGRKPDLDDRKLGKLVTQVARDWKLDLDSAQWDASRALVEAAQAQGIVPTGQGTGLREDSPELWRELAGEVGLLPEEQEKVWELAREVLRASNEAMLREGKITFGDQVYGALVFGGRFLKYPSLMVDESQDLSSLDQELVRRSLMEDSKLYCVGDSRQSIYAFRGADAQAMRNLRALRPNWTDLPLMTSFRVPQLVAARQQRHVPGFRAAEWNPRGTVVRLGMMSNDLEEDAPGKWTWREVVAACPRPGASIAVLCRNNSPLLGLAFKLLRSGIGVQMLGRDIGKGLVMLSRKISPQDSESSVEFVAKVKAWEEQQLDLSRAAGRSDAVLDGIQDRAECLRAVAESSGAPTVGSLRELLGKLFAREGDLITLSTVHKAKGLEWDCVVHLDPWRVPGKRAKAKAVAGFPAELEQELNIKYVCETRTRHTLVMANLADFRGVGG